MKKHWQSVFLSPDFNNHIPITETHPVAGTIKNAKMELIVGVEPQSYSTKNLSH